MALCLGAHRFFCCTFNFFQQFSAHSNIYSVLHSVNVLSFCMLRTHTYACQHISLRQPHTPPLLILILIFPVKQGGFSTENFAECMCNKQGENNRRGGYRLVSPQNKSTRWYCKLKFSHNVSRVCLREKFPQGQKLHSVSMPIKSLLSDKPVNIYVKE